VIDNNPGPIFPKGGPHNPLDEINIHAGVIKHVIYIVKRNHT
jgi:hypothetical protein